MKQKNAISKKTNFREKINCRFEFIWTISKWIREIMQSYFFWFSLFVCPRIVWLHPTTYDLTDIFGRYSGLLICKICWPESNRFNFSAPPSIRPNFKLFNFAGQRATTILHKLTLKFFQNDPKVKNEYYHKISPKYSFSLQSC